MMFAVAFLIDVVVVDRTAKQIDSTCLVVSSMILFCSTITLFTYYSNNNHNPWKKRKKKRRNSSSSASSIISFSSSTPASVEGEQKSSMQDEDERERTIRRPAAPAAKCSLQEYMTHCYAMRQIFSRASFDSDALLFATDNTSNASSATTRFSNNNNNRSYRHYDQSDSFVTTVSDSRGNNRSSRRTSTVAEGSDDEEDPTETTLVTSRRFGRSDVPPGPGLDNSEHTTTDQDEDLHATIRMGNHGHENDNERHRHYLDFFGRNNKTNHEETDSIGGGPSPSASFLDPLPANNSHELDSTTLPVVPFPQGQQQLRHSISHPLPTIIPHHQPGAVSSFHETRRQRLLARQTYNASILPNKVIMVRHGQSAGNTNEELFSQMPDHSIPLTELGWEQAKMAGKALKESIIATGETVHFIVSPYVRTMETFHGILSAWCDPTCDEDITSIESEEERKRVWYQKLHNDYGITWHEDPRIREQDFGNYQDVDLMKESKLERQRFGLFYYRFQNGESGTDVFDRVSTFLDSLWRSFDTCRYQNCVLVTHGISIRVLLARYFRYSVDQFHELANPKNCEMCILNHDGSGMLRLQGRCQLQTKTVTIDEDNDTDTASKTKVTGYELHNALRVYPEKYTKRTKRKIRISFDG